MSFATRVLGRSLWLLALSGCASTQLNYNTVEVSSGIDNIYTKETLNNISKFVDNKFAIPSQMLIGAGTIQTVNTVNPSVSVPLTAQIGQTVTNAVTGAASSTGLTGTNVHTYSSIAPSISATNSQQQSFTVAPLNDALSLMNQQALYQHAVYDTDLLITYHPPRVFVNGHFFYDPFSLQYPQCILCAVHQRAAFKSSCPTPQNADAACPQPVLVNRNLRKGKWIIADVSPSADLVDLGRYGNHELFMSKADYDNGVLTNFVLATLSYSAPTETFGGAPAPSVIVNVNQAAAGPPSTTKKTTVEPHFVSPQAAPSAPTNNFRGTPFGVPGLNLVIPQQINPSN